MTEYKRFEIVKTDFGSEGQIIGVRRPILRFFRKVYDVRVEYKTALGKTRSRIMSFSENQLEKSSKNKKAE